MPEGSAPLAANLERDLEWVLSICEVEICHGDLHPFNVLVDDRGQTTVLDWSAEVVDWLQDSERGLMGMTFDPVDGRLEQRRRRIAERRRRRRAAC